MYEKAETSRDDFSESLRTITRRCIFNGNAVAAEGINRWGHKAGGTNPLLQDSIKRAQARNAKRKAIEANRVITKTITVDLPKVLLLQKKELPPISGIYFVIVNAVCVYVGMSRNLNKRWHNHTYIQIFKECTRMGADVYIAWMYVAEGQILEVEKDYIKKVNPIFNDSKRAPFSAQQAIKESKAGRPRKEKTQ